MAARPIIIPSTPYSFLNFKAFSGESTSPFPKIGMVILGLFFTLAMCDQSACPLYIWARVRAWMLKAATPMSCNRSATSSIFMEESSQPKRVFTVTGRSVLSITACVNRIIKSTSFKTPAPAPLQTTFFTGHPKLISIISGFTVLTIFEESAMASSSPPKIWIPTGRS